MKKNRTDEETTNILKEASEGKLMGMDYSEYMELTKNEPSDLLKGLCIVEEIEVG